MLVIRKSIIPGAGKGLRTTSPIRKGDLIVEYKGENMTWEQCLRRYRKNINHAAYLFFVSSKNCVDAQNTLDELARYANDANGFVKVKGITNNSEYCIVKGKPYIKATKNIPANSEIFVDYAGDYWEMMGKEYEEDKKPVVPKREAHHEKHQAKAKKKSGTKKSTKKVTKKATKKKASAKKKK